MTKMFITENQLKNGIGNSVSMLSIRTWSRDSCAFS